MGWNLIGFGTKPTNLLFAHDLAQSLEVQGIDPQMVCAFTRGRWEVFLTGRPFNDFLLKDATGYMVYVSNSGVWTFEESFCP